LESSRGEGTKARDGRATSDGVVCSALRCSGVERTNGWRSDMHYSLQVNRGRIMRSVWTSVRSTGCARPQTTKKAVSKTDCSSSSPHRTDKDVNCGGRESPTSCSSRLVLAYQGGLEQHQGPCTVRAPDDTGWSKPPAASSETLLAKALLGNCKCDSRHPECWPSQLASRSINTCLVFYGDSA
jgi:hypothetical protein